jgi:phage gp45-like
MGFLDKAKEKATSLAEKAKDKVEDVQAKRKADELLEDLGRIVYGRHTNRPPDGADAELARLVGELQKLEETGVQVLEPKPASASEG